MMGSCDRPNPSDPRDHNRYAYVRNNPLKYTDPSGHCILGLPCPKPIKDAKKKIAELRSDMAEQIRAIASIYGDGAQQIVTPAARSLTIPVPAGASTCTCVKISGGGVWGGEVTVGIVRDGYDDVGFLVAGEGGGYAGAGASITAGFEVNTADTIDQLSGTTASAGGSVALPLPGPYGSRITIEIQTTVGNGYVGEYIGAGLGWGTSFTATGMAGRAWVSKLNQGDSKTAGSKPFYRYGTYRSTTDSWAW